MTAGASSLLWNGAISCSTIVDSALPGSHATASFSWASVSLFAGPNASASTITQKPRMSHFATLLDGNRAKRDIVHTSGGRGLQHQRFPDVTAPVNAPL